MTSIQSLRLYDLLLKYFNNDADAKAFVSELEIALKENHSNNEKIYTTKNEIDILKKDIEIFRQETKTGFAETKSELKTEINKLIVWIVATFLAGGGLMIVIAKIFFTK